MSYHVGGSATGGTDYDPLPGRVTFTAGSAEAFIPAVAHTGHGKIKVFVDAGPGYAPANAKGKLLLATLFP